MSESHTEQPSKPSPEHERLGSFIGTWKTEGQTRAAAGVPSIRIVGTDAYEWLAGGFFLVHRVDVRMGDAEVKALEIIGYEAASQRYSTRFFDNQGNTGTYQMSVRDGIWTLETKSERATVVFSGDGKAMTAHWERSDDGSSWVPWMDVNFTRVG